MVKFRGLAGPKGLPENVTRAWDEAVQKVLEDPDYKKAYTEEVLVAKFIPHKDYPAFVNDFATTTENFLKETGAIK
jgi:tripartite-type tricarboxylate transporter receptor subunit TctC